VTRCTASACACAPALGVRSSRLAAARAASSSPSELADVACEVLPQHSRLHTAAEFRAVTRRGRRAGTATLVAHFLVDPNGGQRRAGFVVSRAVGNAV